LGSDVTAPELWTANQELRIKIGEFRHRQQSLEEVRRYVDLFDFAPVTYALLDTVGMIVNVNLAACRLLNVQRRHLVGHPFLGFVVQEDRRQLLEHLRRCRRDTGIVESELRVAAQGSSTAVTCRLFSKRAVYDKQDTFPTVIIDQTDHMVLNEARLIAERQRATAEQAAESARAESAAKDRFLNIVSHELRTPLTPALFAASRLTSWEGLPDEARRLAQTIKRNIEFEARLIDDLLDVARINRNRLSLRLDTVDAHEVVRDAVAICAAVAQTKQVTVTLSLMAGAHHVKADRARLRQVFWNLLHNAIKFTDAGGGVVIRSTNIGDTALRVSVRDSGAGMAADVLENLFAPFDRRPVVNHEPNGEESRAGLGLGLAICKGIVAAHGGQIWGTSEGPRQGSTFGVELATTDARASEAGGGRSPVEPETSRVPERSLRVLVVEDDPDSGEMLALFLSHYGHHVEVASSLSAATSKLEEHWDAVLSDIALPDGSGLDVARRVRQMSQPPERVIALSGFGSNDDIRASLEAGFDDHLVKPIDLDQLLLALAPPAGK
jgi:PAS domain S-box-containing protein